MQTQVLVDEAVEALQSQIDDTAIIACSGGIDSTVRENRGHRAVDASGACDNRGVVNLGLQSLDRLVHEDLSLHQGSLPQRLVIGDDSRGARLSPFGESG